MYTFFILWSILFYPVVPFDYSHQAGRSGVHSRVVPSTQHTLGPRDAVRRYLRVVSPVCCGCDARVEPRNGHFGQDVIIFFFTIAPYGAFLSGRACTLRCISARCLPSEGWGGAVRRWHQDLALLVATSYSRPRGRVRPCCCCALLVALLFFVVVIPQTGQLTFHASSSSARSIFIFFHGPTDTSVSCGGLPLCFPGRAVRER